MGPSTGTSPPVVSKRWKATSAVPPGGDAYLLKWIVHDWDDEAAIRS